MILHPVSVRTWLKGSKILADSDSLIHLTMLIVTIK